MISIDNLAAGTYYVVSESNAENGFITTNIEAYGGYAGLSTTMGQSHIPTIASDDVLSLGADEVRHDIQYYSSSFIPTL